MRLRVSKFWENTQSSAATVLPRIAENVKFLRSECVLCFRSRWVELGIRGIILKAISSVRPRLRRTIEGDSIW